MQLNLKECFGKAALGIMLMVTGPVAAGRGPSCEIGEICADGTKLAGMSAFTGRPLYTTPDDAPSPLPWNDGAQGWRETGLGSLDDGRANVVFAQAHDNAGRLRAVEYCAGLKAHGHADWYLPSARELKTLYNNHTRIGGFDTTSGAAYWSSSEHTQIFAESIDFADGFSNGTLKNSALHIRCVRQ